MRPHSEKKTFRKYLIAALVSIVPVLSAVALVYIADINVPYLCYSGPHEGIWSIGVYDLRDDGQSLSMTGKGANPILTAADITDTPTRFVADPFIIGDKGLYYLFFEVLGVDRGVIGLATSTDALHWRYERTVLQEPFHLSYPNVFKWEGGYYLVPESLADRSVRLYRATRFPDEWRFVKRIITDRPLVDSTVFAHQGLLWMFSSSPDNENLYLFYADRPEGPWHEHPKNPVVKGNSRNARPAGNVLDTGTRLIRFSQDSQAYGEKYGIAVLGFEIMMLTREHYQERPLEGNPLIKGSGTGWNAAGMHQISAWPTGQGQWIAAVDGKRRSGQYLFCVGNAIFRVP